MQNLKVIYEDNHIIVVEKVPNIPSQADKTGDVDMLSLVKDYIKEKYNKPGNVYLGLVHRLDRPVGGIMIFAKTSKAASRLSNEVREKVFKKKYLAVVDGKIEEESLKLFLTAYQNKKALSMEEIWSLPLFLGIAIIEQIREICKKIYMAQIQKYKVESMIERLVEQKDKTQQNFNEQTKQIKRKKRKYELSIYRIFIL